MHTSVELVAGDRGSVLRVTVTDQAGTAVDLTGKAVQLRYTIGPGELQIKTMTVLNQTTNKGQADYQFAAADLSDGILEGEVRLNDGQPDQLTSVDKFYLPIRAPKS